MDLSLIRLLLLMWCLSVSVCSLVTVILNIFRREDLIKECETFLVEGDRLLMNGTVSFDSELTDTTASISLMNRQKANGSEYNLFYFVLTKHCKNGDVLYCVRREDSNVFDVYANLIASDQLSEGFLMLTVHYNNMDFNSTEVKLPKILDFSTASLKLNGQVILQNKENIELNESYIELCCELEQFPCHSFIFPLFSPIMNGSKCIINKPMNEETVKYTVGFFVCASSKYLKLYDVEVSAAYNQSDGMGSDSSCTIELKCHALALIVIATLIVTVFLTTGANWYYFKAYRVAHYVVPSSDDLSLDSVNALISNPDDVTIINGAEVMNRSAAIMPKGRGHRGHNARRRGDKKF